MDISTSGLLHYVRAAGKFVTKRKVIQDEMELCKSGNIIGKNTYMGVSKTLLKLIAMPKWRTLSKGMDLAPPHELQSYLNETVSTMCVLIVELRKISEYQHAKFWVSAISKLMF